MIGAEFGCGRPSGWEPIVGSLESDAYGPSPSMSLTAVPPTHPSKYRLVVATRGSSPIRVVEAAGEVDLLTAQVLADCIVACLADGTPPIVVVDLRRVHLLTSAGLTVLAAAAQHAHAQDTSLRLVVTTPPVHRALSATGLDHKLAIYPALEPALTT